MIAAGETTHFLAAHRPRDVAAQQHRRDQTDLIDVVTLLPAADLTPRNLARRVEGIESVGRDAAVA
jgi:hypothetical protein